MSWSSLRVVGGPETNLKRKVLENEVRECQAHTNSDAKSARFMNITWAALLIDGQNAWLFAHIWHRDAVQAQWSK